MKKENSIIIINSLNKIIDIFLGPFLIAYFIKTSNESLVDLSVYKILCFFFLGLNSIIAGYFVEKNHGLFTFRIGVVSRFIYILLIILLKENILNHLYLMSFLWGLSTILFWYPFNIFSVFSIKNEKRAEFESKKKFLSNLISIIFPIFLGTIISCTNYRMTALIILFFSFLEIATSFYLSPLPLYKYNYSLIGTFNKLKRIKDIKFLLFYELLFDMCISDSALSVIITIFVINSFKTDVNLGIINSISSLLTLIVIFSYSKLKKDSEKLYSISIFLIVICSFLLFLFGTSISIIIYNACFEILASGLFSLIETIELNKISNKVVEVDDMNEFMVIREIILNIGRVISYCILIITIMININYLKYIFLLFNLLFVFLKFILKKISD